MAFQIPGSFERWKFASLEQRGQIVQTDTQIRCGTKELGEDAARQ